MFRVLKATNPAAVPTFIPPLEPADLPEKKAGFWQLAGPGAILVGLAIGAGEIMLWPWMIDKFGPGIAWAAFLGVFIQFWINLEIARYTVVTGETVYTALGRISPIFGPVFILFNLFGWIAPAWAMASGLSLKALLVGSNGWGSGATWTAITFAICAVTLFGPKLVYAGVEKMVSVLVAIITVGLVVVAAVVGTGKDWAELGQGIAGVGHVPQGLDTKMLFIAITAAGAAGTANLFYSFYLRDKHIGMGGRLPEMRNPLRDRTEKESTTGFVYPETPENAGRFRAWFQHVAKDQALFFWGLNSLTVLLFIFVGIAVLRDTPEVLNQGQIIGAEADALRAALPGMAGAAMRVLFLLVGFATLFSTQITLIDGVARSLTEILHVQMPAARKKPAGWWYLVIAGSWMVGSTLLAWYLDSRKITEMGFLFSASYVGGICMAVYTPLLLWINHTRLPKSARPGVLCTVMCGGAALFYVVFSVLSIVWEFGRGR
jgi:hypothetical protein